MYVWLYKILLKQKNCFIVILCRAIPNGKLEDANAKIRSRKEKLRIWKIGIKIIIKIKQEKKGYTRKNIQKDVIYVCLFAYLFVDSNEKICYAYK